MPPTPSSRKRRVNKRPTLRDRAMALKAPWVNRLVTDIEVKDIEAMQRVLASLRAKLDTELSGADGA
ncbi:hypothetical protein D3C71_1415190 [compost metagenome]